MGLSLKAPPSRSELHLPRLVLVTLSFGYLIQLGADLASTVWLSYEGQVTSSYCHSRAWWLSF